MDFVVKTYCDLDQNTKNLNKDQNSFFSSNDRIKMSLYFKTYFNLQPNRHKNIRGSSSCSERRH